MNLKHLSNLSNAELNALAATNIYGWTSCRSPFQAKGDTDEIFWRTPRGEMRKRAFTPATDRNQSGELLTAMMERGACFTVGFWPDGAKVTWWPERRAGSLGKVVPGTSPRSETIAALCAWFAMEELSQ
jgi:hypothetical protein